MKLFFTLIFLISNYGLSFSQDTSQIKFKITTCPTKFLFIDFPITFEKVFTRKTLGLTISYRPSTEKNGKVNGGAGLAGYYSDQNFWNHLYNALTLEINSKYFFTPSEKLYLEGIIFYRYWWFNKKYAEYDNVERIVEVFNGTRTERQNVFGIKLLFGKSFLFKTKFKLKPVMDLYCGLGIRYKTYVFETFNGTVGYVYYNYYVERFDNFTWGDGITPSIQLGIKIGCGF